MKFVTMFLGLLACAVSAKSHYDIVVEEARAGFPNVRSTLVEARKATGIPLRKR